MSRRAAPPPPPPPSPRGRLPSLAGLSIGAGEGQGEERSDKRPASPEPTTEPPPKAQRTGPLGGERPLPAATEKVIRDAFGGDAVDAVEQILLALKTEPRDMRLVCDTVFHYCGVFKGLCTEADDGMFRVLLSLFGTVPNGQPATPAPFPSWKALFKKLCSTFSDPIPALSESWNTMVRHMLGTESHRFGARYIARLHRPGWRAPQDALKEAIYYNTITQRQMDALMDVLLQIVTTELRIQMVPTYNDPAPFTVRGYKNGTRARPEFIDQAKRWLSEHGGAPPDANHLTALWKLLWLRGARPFRTVEIYGSQDEALRQAVAANDVDAVRQLLTTTDADPNQDLGFTVPRHLGMPAAHDSAIEQGDAKTRSTKDTLLSEQFANRNWPMARVLLQNGAATDEERDAFRLNQACWSAVLNYDPDVPPPPGALPPDVYELTLLSIIDGYVRIFRRSWLGVLDRLPALIRFSERVAMFSERWGAAEAQAYDAASARVYRKAVEVAEETYKELPRRPSALTADVYFQESCNTLGMGVRHRMVSIETTKTLLDAFFESAKNNKKNSTVLLRMLAAALDREVIHHEQYVDRRHHMPILPEVLELVTAFFDKTNAQIARNKQLRRNAKAVAMHNGDTVDSDDEEMDDDDELRARYEAAVTPNIACVSESALVSAMQSLEG